MRLCHHASVSFRAATLRRIEALKAALPTTPMRDVVMSRVSQPWVDIAHLYQKLGDTDAAAEWYRRAAEYNRNCGDIIGALALVRMSLRKRPNARAAQALYAELWQLSGIGGPPDPLE